MEIGVQHTERIFKQTVSNSVGIQARYRAGAAPVAYSLSAHAARQQDIRADTRVIRFAYRVTGDGTLTSKQVGELVTAAATILPGDSSSTLLDHPM